MSDRIGSRNLLIFAGTINYALACLGLAFLPWSPGFPGMTLFAMLAFALLAIIGVTCIRETRCQTLTLLNEEVDCEVAPQ